MRVWRIAVLVLVGCSSPPAKPTRPAKPATTCTDVANHMLDLIEPKDDHAQRIREIFAVRCEHDAWEPEARVCVTSTTSLKDPKHCKAKLSTDQRDALERDIAGADKLRAGKWKSPACDRYKQLIEKLASCDKLPQQSRDALKDGFDAMIKGWENAGEMPEEARKAMEDACTQGSDALTQAVTDLCGW